MKRKELEQVRRLMTVVIAKPSLGDGQRDRLLKAKRELDKVACSGKLERERICRIVRVVSELLLEHLESGK